MYGVEMEKREESGKGNKCVEKNWHLFAYINIYTFSLCLSICLSVCLSLSVSLSLCVSLSLSLSFSVSASFSVSLSSLSSLSIYQYLACFFSLFSYPPAPPFFPLSFFLSSSLTLSFYFLSPSTHPFLSVSVGDYLWTLPNAKEHLRLVEADLLKPGDFDACFEGCDGVFHTARSGTISHPLSQYACMLAYISLRTNHISQFLFGSFPFAFLLLASSSFPCILVALS